MTEYSLKGQGLTYSIHQNCPPAPLPRYADFFETCRNSYIFPPRC
jgi:hypothetical protein